MSLTCDPCPVTDIPEIPESIKFCKALEIADFSGNPLSRWGAQGVVAGGGGCRYPGWECDAPSSGLGSLKASPSCAAWPTWP